MNLLSRCATVLLLCGLGVAHAQAPAPTDGAGTHHKAAQWCEKNPERCAERKALHEKRCAENPQKCAEMKQRMEERRAQCAADPEKCKAERRQKMEKHREHLQERCLEKPDGRACKQLQKHDQRADRKADAGAK